MKVQPCFLSAVLGCSRSFILLFSSLFCVLIVLNVLLATLSTLSVILQISELFFTLGEVLVSGGPGLSLQTALRACRPVGTLLTAAPP